MRRNLLLLQATIAIVTLLVGKPHTMLHNMDWPLPTPEQVGRFNFIGVDGSGTPSIWAVLLETAAWSFLGIMARAAYRISRTIKARREVDSITAIAEVLGDAAAGTSIAVALVALLWSSELKVITFELTLKDASVGTVIAVAFILGFFHDRTQRFVGLVQGKLFAGAEDSSSDKAKGSVNPQLPESQSAQLARVAARHVALAPEEAIPANENRETRGQG